MTAVLITLHILVTIALIVIILLQRSEGGIGLGAGAGSTMSGRPGSTPMTRATSGLITIFFITSMAMTILAKPSSDGESLLTPSSAQEENGETPLPILPNLPESQN